MPFDPALSLQALGRQDAEGAMKVREDLDRYRRVIRDSRPDVVLECGTWLGGSSAWFARQGLDVVTVDIADYVPDHVRHPRVTYMLGDSVDPGVAAAAIEACADRRTMVVLDSDHHPNHVEREIAMYSQAVTLGCYLVVEDGVMRYIPSGFPTCIASPLDAIERVLCNDPAWLLGREVEDMHPVSMHPLGWWRRLA